MSDIPGFAAPVYRSLTQPQLLGGVSQRFFICVLAGMVITGLWCLVVPGLWPGLLLGLAAYVVVWSGTQYDTEFFEILVEHVQHKERYEG